LFAKHADSKGKQATPRNTNIIAAAAAAQQVRVRHPALLELFAKHADSKGKQAKLKSPNQLQELLDISRSILQVRTSFLDHAMLCWGPVSLGEGGGFRN
jgi:hypothetical protein